MGEDFDNPKGIKFKSGKLKTMSSQVDMAVFPGNQGGPLEHVVGAKAIAFGEALEEDFLNYIVITNINQVFTISNELNYYTDNDFFYLESTRNSYSNDYKFIIPQGVNGYFKFIYTCQDSGYQSQ